jgi:hypothetical protein
MAIDVGKAPEAFWMNFGECGNPACEAVHVAFLRRDGKPLARMAFGVEHIEALAGRAGFKLVREAH